MLSSVKNTSWHIVVVRRIVVVRDSLKEYNFVNIFCDRRYTLNIRSL